LGKNWYKVGERGDEGHKRVERGGKRKAAGETE
jgi:hypothetical protein